MSRREDCRSCRVAQRLCPLFADEVRRRREMRAMASSAIDETGTPSNAEDRFLGAPRLREWGPSARASTGGLAQGAPSTRNHDRPTPSAPRAITERMGYSVATSRVHPRRARLQRHPAVGSFSKNRRFLTYSNVTVTTCRGGYHQGGTETHRAQSKRGRPTIGLTPRGCRPCRACRNRREGIHPGQARRCARGSGVRAVRGQRS